MMQQIKITSNLFFHKIKKSVYSASVKNYKYILNIIYKSSGEVQGSLSTTWE